MRRWIALPVLVGALVLALVLGIAFRPRPPEPVAPREAAPPPWGELGPSDRVLVLGVSGTGKTTYVKRLLTGTAAPASRPAARVLYGDPQGDYGDVAEPITLAELKALVPELRKADRFAFAVQLDGDTEEELGEQVEELIGYARAIARCVLVLDEVGDYADTARKALSRLARNGRHDAVASVFVSQAAVEIPKACRRQATRVFSFLQTDPADLKALERFGPGFIGRVSSWVRGAGPATWVLPSLSELPSC